MRRWIQEEFAYFSFRRNYGVLNLEEERRIRRELQLPEFNGKNCNDWVQEMEDIFHFFQLDEMEKMKVVIMSLVGEALRWFEEEQRKRKFFGWSELKPLLVLRFGSPMCRQEQHTQAYHEGIEPVEEEEMREESEMVADVVEREDISKKPPLRSEDENGKWRIGETFCFIADDNICRGKVEGPLKRPIVTGISGSRINLILGQEGGTGCGSGGGLGSVDGQICGKGGNTDGWEDFHGWLKLGGEGEKGESADYSGQLAYFEGTVGGLGAGEYVGNGGSHGDRNGYVGDDERLKKAEPTGGSGVLFGRCGGPITGDLSCNVGWHCKGSLVIKISDEGECEIRNLENNPEVATKGKVGNHFKGDIRASGLLEPRGLNQIKRNSDILNSTSKLGHTLPIRPTKLNGNGEQNGPPNSEPKLSSDDEELFRTITMPQTLQADYPEPQFPHWTNPSSINPTHPFKHNPPDLQSLPKSPKPVLDIFKPTSNTQSINSYFFTLLLPTNSILTSHYSVSIPTFTPKVSSIPFNMHYQLTSASSPSSQNSAMNNCWLHTPW